MRLVSGIRQQRRPRVDDAVLEGMRRMGATEQDLAEVAAAHAAPPPDKDEFEVHWDVWDSWLFFLSVQTQWVHAGFGGERLSLNWPGIESSARMRRVPAKQLQGFADDLVEIERQVLKTDSELAAGRRKGR